MFPRISQKLLSEETVASQWNGEGSLPGWQHMYEIDRCIKLKVKLRGNEQYKTQAIV